MNRFTCAGASSERPQRALVASVSEQPGISEMDKLLFTYLGKQSPVIPLGCVITAGILGSGFTQFKSGNRKASQLFMRARVVSQGITVTLMMVSLYAQKRQQELGWNAPA
mmetsp:Transcript_62741/g.101512  ORF Transcript_62741/g.101512 Transcript_62741/m.101512 type:complete len:110 (-) Transcript_62741:117-446(-)|eukprot:CAMPEP_0179422292 /NCGR_PEP_ID=MMETSP0799-20121207/10335_1 /TAXON_ID=46947 /ORGANISM="Geminigera cryophila, Strain CCMP2564" /LENGTH=109 /DNA_ID=CAMNT_0021196383 /DNA_START=1 /DNA_END=330 /DNA_ORIENTATION=+